MFERNESHVSDHLPITPPSTSILRRHEFPTVYLRIWKEGEGEGEGQTVEDWKQHKGTGNQCWWQGSRPLEPTFAIRTHYRSGERALAR